MAPPEHSEHLFRTIAGHPKIMIWAIDKNGIITISEGAGLELFGVQPGALVGSNVFDVYADTPEILPNMRRALNGETLDYSVAMPGPDGMMNLDSRLRPQFSAAGEVIGVTAITFEVSERVALENKLRRAETMEAIGMLVGGVAHDFNNLLTAIIGFASVARRADQSKREEYLGHVIESADRGAALVRQLLSFARKDEIRPERVDLSEFLESNMPLYRQVLSENVGVDLSIVEDTHCHIQIDRSKLEQVFLNLVTNAGDAMPSGGQLHMRLRPSESHSDEGWVVVEVTDTGEGMNQATQECIFDPFFSRRKQGSGLGLATSHSIVSRAGGSLTVTSAPGEGATFRLRFRCQQAAPGPGSPAEAKAQVRPSRTGTVLLVDDNEAVLQSTALLLEEEGYSVCTAQSGQKGYDLFTKSDQKIDIVVTDMTMPGMKGDELAVLIRKMDKTTPILCVSGYQGYSASLDGLDRLAVLSKPYRGDDLTSLIDKMLKSK